MVVTGVYTGGLQPSLIPESFEIILMSTIAIIISTLISWLISKNWKVVLASDVAILALLLIYFLSSFVHLATY